MLFSLERMQRRMVKFNLDCRIGKGGAYLPEIQFWWQIQMSYDKRIYCASMLRRA
jgi:hypothetical protein